MKNVLAVLAAVLLFAIAPVFAGMDQTFKGHYYLNIQGLSRYGTDILRIRFMSDGKVTGEVGLDWGIGPQARTPMEHEKYYNLPFEAKVIHGGKAFRFQVTVNRKTVYDFTLFFVYNRDYRNTLAGSVKVSPVRKGSGGLSGTYGVIADRVFSEN